jgi:hypothetical protein
MKKIGVSSDWWGTISESSRKRKMNSFPGTGGMLVWLRGG